APPLEEFDPEMGELFEATGADGKPDLGIAFVRDGKICSTTLGREEDRIIAESKSTANGKSAKDRERRLERLLRSLPFPTVRDAIYPLGADPTAVSVGEWEKRNGPILEALIHYFTERTVGDPDVLCLMGIYTI